MKVYHLMVGFDCNQFKALLDRVLQYEREVAEVGRLVEKFKKSQEQKQP